MRPGPSGPEDDPPGERELEDLLRRAPPARPASSFREEARTAFLGNQEARSSPSRAAPPHRMGPVMGADEHDDFEAWLAARRISSPAPGELRRRCRAAFLSVAAAGAPALRRHPRAVQALVLALAAAAILAVTFLLPEPERWRVRLEGPLRFAGVEYAPGDERELAARLEGSGTIESSSAGARLELGGGLELQLLASSTLALPVLPELDGATPIELELLQGETFLRTSRSYPGNPIRIRTPMADVHVLGTTLGVLVNELGTCVCVAEGSVSVTSDRLPGLSQAVGARSTLQVFQDRTMGPKSAAFPEEETEPEYAHTHELVVFQEEP